MQNVPASPPGCVAPQIGGSMEGRLVVRAPVRSTDSERVHCKYEIEGRL